MNLVLLEEHEVVGDRVEISDRRAEHVREVHRAEPGRRLRVGVLGGAIGVGTVVDISADAVALSLELTEAPPRPLPVTLVVAMPRPKVLRRVLRAVTVLGVKRLVIVNAATVDKSYFHTPALEEARVRQDLLLGLEQAGDTVLPTVTVERRFRPFVEDRLPTLARGATLLVAHPGASEGVGAPAPSPAVLAIGPERGFVAFELDLLKDVGFRGVSLGPRVLPTEVAVASGLGHWAAPSAAS